MDETAFSRRMELMQYIDGDYQDPATFAQLRKALGGATRPAHYLAIPPSLFPTAVEGLGRSGCAENARVIVEKPFGRPPPPDFRRYRPRWSCPARAPRPAGPTAIR